MFYVYVLARPNGKAFYVGKGKNARIFHHENEARSDHKCHKCNVIRKIWRAGGQVQRYTVLTTEDEDEAFAYEKELIAIYGRENLTNKTDGGDGANGYIATDEVRAKISAAAKRQFQDPKQIEFQQQKLRKQWEDPAFRETVCAALARSRTNPDKIRRAAESNRKRWQDPAFREKQSAIRKRAWQNPNRKRPQGNKRTPEGMARFSAKIRAKWQDPEFRERRLAQMRETAARSDVRARQKAAMNTPEYLAKRSETSRRLANDPNHRAKISRAAKSRWQDPAYRQKTVEAQTRSKNTPERKAQTSATSRAHWQDPAYRAKMAEVAKARWQNPEYREKVLGNLKQAQRKRTTQRPEQTDFLTILEDG